MAIEPSKTESPHEIMTQSQTASIDPGQNYPTLMEQVQQLKLELEASEREKAELRHRLSEQEYKDGKVHSDSTTIREAERHLIFKTLGQTGGNRTRAAKILGISIRTLRNKLREYRENEGENSGKPEN